MRYAKWGMLIAAMAFVVGTRPARACDVVGSVVCEGSLSPVEGVVPTFTHYHWDGTVVTYTQPPYATDANGQFFFHVDGQYCGEWYDVSLDPAGAEPAFSLADPVFIEYATPLVLAPFQVSASEVAACGTPPSCVDPALNATHICTNKLRGAEEECAAVGLVPILKQDTSSPIAALDAALALVKAGTCYTLFTPVTAGQLLGTWDGKAISHVTYCACPAP